MRDVLSVRKATTAVLFDNAVEVTHVDGKREFFTSFLSRNHAYNLIMRNWAQAAPHAHHEMILTQQRQQLQQQQQQLQQQQQQQ